MVRSISLFAILFLFSTISFGQTNYNNSLPSILPPSPVASEFLKYGEIPISKYTGTPNINIPIYTIEAKGLNVPINISYHSNGIKISEEASNVGLGWKLNTGGSIVQVINGFDDFGNFQNRTFLDVDAVFNAQTNGSAPGGILSNCGGTVIGLSETHIPNIPGDQTTSNPHLGCLITPDDIQYSLPIGFVAGNLDFEPDVFKFNMLGYSGEFILNWETGNFNCLTDNKMKIEEYGNGFKIKVPDGHAFVFEKMEESEFFLYDSPSTNSIGDSLVFFNEKSSIVYHLVDIFTNKGDNIHYNYEETNFIINLPSINASEVVHRSVGAPFGFHQALLTPQFNRSGIFTKQKNHYISSINFNNGTIEFAGSNRLDLIGAKKIDDIIIRNINGLAIKSFNFNYDYFVGHNEGRTFKNEFAGTGTFNILNQKTSQELTHRLRLKSISENGLETHEFEYNNTQLPSKISLASDYWGNYSGYNDNQTMFPDITRFNVNTDGLNFNSASYNNNKSPNIIYLKAGILEKIIYPTKGYTLFDYEMNNFDNNPIPEYDSNTTNPSGPYYGAGLRIKKIEGFDNDDLKISSKQYTYSGGKLMTPLSLINFTFLAEYDGDTSYFNPNTGSNIILTTQGRGHRVTLSSSNFNSPSLIGNSNYVGYSEVAEEQMSLQTGNVINGKIVDVYSNEELEGGFGNPLDDSQITNGHYRELNMPLREKNYIVNGLLIEQSIYDNNEILLRTSENEYGYNTISGCAHGAKLGGVYRNDFCSEIGLPGYDGYQTLGIYPIKKTNSYVISSKTTKYFNNQSLEVVEEYSYNSFTQLTGKRITNSNNDIIEEKYYHPHDYNSNGITLFMKIANFLTPILRKEIKVNGELL